MATRRSRYSEEDLAAHNNAINRALGLGLTVSQTDSSPDTEDQDQETIEYEVTADVDLIEIEDTTEEDILLSEEEQGSQAASSSPQARSQVSSPNESYRLELTIDLTDSPTTTSLPVSPPASQSSCPAKPSNPPYPALQCPVCLDTFSAIRSRGEHIDCPPVSSLPLLTPHFQGCSWSAQSVATSSAGNVSSSVS